MITANAMGLEEGAGAPSSDGLRAGAGYGDKTTDYIYSVVQRLWMRAIFPAVSILCCSSSFLELTFVITVKDLNTFLLTKNNFLSKHFNFLSWAVLYSIYNQRISGHQVASSI